MRAITLICSVLFLAIASAQTEVDQQQCTTVCQVTSQPNVNNDGSFVIYMSEDVIYFYMIQYNAFVVVNIKLRLVIVIDGNNGTITSLNPDTGFGIITNIETNLVFAFTQNLQIFDITTINSGDYSVVVQIIEYVYQYTVKVVGSNIDTTEIGYADSTVILRDYSTTTDFTQWVSYGEQTEVVQLLIQSNTQVAEILFKLFESHEYTVEWGPVMYLIVATGSYEINDRLLIEFNNFAVSIVRTLYGRFDSYLMKEYYLILVSQQTQTTEITIEQYRNLTWVINGVGTTYETLQIALNAYAEQTVVQTYVSTISVNETHSYVAYNSMREGTWLFRITYSQQHYVQVTASYHDGYMGIFDPSQDYTMVFTSTNKFALINYKTGNGFIIDGFTQSATYLVANSEEIIIAFAEGRYIDGFKRVKELTENTEIEENASFNATLFFIALKNGDSYENMLSQEQLDSFQADFAQLAEQLSEVDFENGFGISNIAVVMLAGPNTKFFQDGFVALLSRMFYFEIAGGPFYRICYAGILENIHKNFSEQLFMNTYQVTLYVKKENKSKEDIIDFMESFVRLSTEPTIDVTTEQFTRDGSIN